MELRDYCPIMNTVRTSDRSIFGNQSNCVLYRVLGKILTPSIIQGTTEDKSRHLRYDNPHSDKAVTYLIFFVVTYLIFFVGMHWFQKCNFWEHSLGPFRGRGGRRGQTTSKSKMTKILNENLLKLGKIQNLASATSKMTSWPQRPWNWLSEFFQKLHF